MAGRIFIGNNSMIATIPNNILIGDSNNMAKTVTSIFVGNTYNQAVQVWPSGLPKEYQEVEYIVSIYNTNFFNTKVFPNTNTRIVIDFEFSELNGKNLYDYRQFYLYSINGINTTGVNAYLYFNLGLGYSNSNKEYYFRSYLNNGQGDIHRLYYSIVSFYDELNKSRNDNEYFMDNFGNQIINRRMVVDANKKNERGDPLLYINNVLVNTFATKIPQTIAGTIYLLAPFNYLASNDSIYPREIYNNICLYNCKIYQGDTLVRDFHPCYKKENPSNVGLYDTIEETFYQCYNPSYPPFPGPKVSSYVPPRFS